MVTVGPTTTISNIRVIAGETIVTLMWTTNEPATSRVTYGRTTALGATVSDATTTTTHRLQITRLAPGKTYYYTLESVGSSVAVSGLSFFTMNTPDGLTNRAIARTLFAPLHRAGLHPTLTIIGVARGGDIVRVYVDGVRAVTVSLTGTPFMVKSFAARFKV